MAEDAARITKLYHDNAYIEATVDYDRPKFDLEKPLATVVYQIEEKGKHYIRDVDVRGNRSTRDDVIRRELSFEPGQPINQDEITRSYYRLYGLQYFNSPQGFPYINIFPLKAPKDFEPPPLPQEKQEVQWDDVIVQVEEGQVGDLRFVVGIGSDSGLIGGIDFTRRNFDLGNWPSSPGAALDEILDGKAFTGGGQTLTMGITPGTEVTTFRLGFQEPYVFGTDNGLDLDLARSLRRFRRYDLERTGLDLRVSHRFTRELALGAGYREEYVSVDRVDFLLLAPIGDILATPDPQFTLDNSVLPGPIFRQRGGHTVRSLSLFATYNTVDNPFLPTEGWNLGLSYEWAPEFLSRRGANFSKALVSAEWYGPIYETLEGSRYGLNVRGSFGWAEENGNDRELAFYESFFAGGRSSVRGFAFQGIGPREYDQAIGGGATVIGGAEFYFPIYGDYDVRTDRYEEFLRGVIFADTGTVSPTLHDQDFGRFRVAVGAGLRIKIPFLGPQPLALDFGIPIAWWDDTYVFDPFGRLIRKDGDVRRVFSFSFGRRF